MINDLLPVLETDPFLCQHETPFMAAEGTDCGALLIGERKIKSGK